MERKFEMKPEFKAMATEALSKLSFSQVHTVMKLIKRESAIYTEQEANAVVGFLGEMAYRDVHHIFEAMPKLITEVTEQSKETPSAEAPVDAEAPAHA
jgi:hypothetical protein